jgi:hypothetical protein
MEFGTVIWVVVLVIAPVAAVLFAGAFGLLDQLGRGGMAINEGPGRPPARDMGGPRAGGALARREREAEIRQLVQARHDRQAARGERPLDVEREVERLLSLDPERPPGEQGPSDDAALRAEVRQLVIARNERRVRQGKEPLDVEAEINRQLRDLSG